MIRKPEVQLICLLFLLDYATATPAVPLPQRTIVREDPADRKNVGGAVSIGDPCHADIDCPLGAVCIPGGGMVVTYDRKFCVCRAGRPLRTKERKLYCPDGVPKDRNPFPMFPLSGAARKAPAVEFEPSKVVGPDWLYPELYIPGRTRLHEVVRDVDEYFTHGDKSEQSFLIPPPPPSSANSPKWLREIEEGLARSSMEAQAPPVYYGQGGQIRTVKELLRTFIELLEARQSYFQLREDQKTANQPDSETSRKRQAYLKKLKKLKDEKTVIMWTV